MTAVLSTTTEIQVTFSGRYGLDLDGGDSGFTVETREGKTYPIKKIVNAESPDDLSKNYARRAIITLGEAVQASDALILKNPIFEGDKQIDSSKLAIEMAEKSLPAKNATLGAAYDAKTKSATFSLWAPTSSKRRSRKPRLYRKYET